MRRDALLLLALLVVGCADPQPILLDPPGPVVVDPSPPSPTPVPAPSPSPAPAQAEILDLVRSLDGRLPIPAGELDNLFGATWREYRDRDGSIVRTWPGTLNVHARIVGGHATEVHVR